MYIKHYLSAKFSVFSAMTLFLVSLTSGCASTSKKVDGKVLTNYTLERGAIVKAKAPLPNMIPVYVKWYAGEELDEKTLGFRGWDFNGDEKFDMLEKLDSNGKVVETVFDFNFDGKVDYTK